MRPLYLEMQGFGPYGNKVQIDFTKFPSSGLYLVTGETGSGKTFIFDALCYALFGEVSGGERKNDMLRTAGLDDNVDTYVTLKFLCKGKEYSITRKPAYVRPKKRGSGMVTSNATVEFSDGVNSAETRVEVINQYIHDVIGLTVDQFKQIVMIAQGKFAMILQKSTKERQELLREIFNTRMYLDLELKVKAETNKFADEYTSCKREIENKLQEIIVSDDKYAEELRQLQNSEYVNVEKVMELLDLFDKEDTRVLAIKTAEEAKLVEEKTILTAALDKINLLLSQQQKLKNLTTEKVNAETDLIRTKADGEKVSEALAFFTDNKEQQITNNTTVQELRALYKAGFDYNKTKLNIVDAKNVLKEAATKALNEQEKYSKVYKQFLGAQAGLLASELKDGDPCPVCGNCEHPNLAHLSYDVPSEDTVNEFKRKADLVEGERQRAQGVVETCEKNKADAWENFNGLAEEFYHKNFVEKDAEKLFKRVTDDGSKASVHQKELEKAAKNKQKEFGMLPDEGVEQFQKRIQEKMNKATESLASISGQMKALQEEIANTKVEGNKEDLQNKLKQNTDLLNDTKQYIKSVEKRKVLNSSVAKKIMEHEEAMTALEKDMMQLDNLYRTLSGNLNTEKAAKISFETYMQQAYFDRILAYANNRLLKISHGRYKLIRRSETQAKGNAKVGLDLNVHDSRSGQERSANSLSGGETFMASLALALGMADEVQASAGGIHINTMFIDEGFGSLSKEYLDATVDILGELARNEYQVGVISHIDELKERIEQQIVVTKTEDGFSTISVEA